MTKGPRMITSAGFLRCLSQRPLIYGKMEEQSNIKEYTVNVDVEYPFINDREDTFEIKLKISNEEIARIVEGDYNLLWNDNGADSWEYIECFAPDAYKRGVALAEEFCVPKWGEQMRVSNGAQYSFFLPDEIWEKVENNPRRQKEVELRKRLKEESRFKFHEESDILEKEHKKGRFKKRLRPYLNNHNAAFDGLWAGSGQYHDYAGDFWFQARVITFRQDVVVNYYKMYKRDEVLLDVRLSDCSTDCMNFICKGLEKWDYTVDRNTIKTQARNNDTDIELFMRVIDMIIIYYFVPEEE